MKKLFVITALVGALASYSNSSKAQVNISVNIGTQPAWVPAGYASVNYYYLPEVEAYYYVPQRQFVYLSGSRWVRSGYLPTRYRGYNLNNCRKIVMHGSSPYRNYASHRTMYTRQVNYVHSSYGGNYRPQRYPSYNNRPQHHKHNKHDDHRRQEHHGKGRH
ncbi:hypothetical protein [Pedobacter sp. MW01-1-1]|uniref:hypothetical protein n=1 Tax=Pedobacter sp. MW01-1-1 TaxID=3383027 RepID=UPI003FF0AE98